MDSIQFSSADTCSGPVIPTTRGCLPFQWTLAAFMGDSSVGKTRQAERAHRPKHVCGDPSFLLGLLPASNFLVSSAGLGLSCSTLLPYPLTICWVKGRGFLATDCASHMSC